MLCCGNRAVSIEPSDVKRCEPDPITHGDLKFAAHISNLAYGTAAEDDEDPERFRTCDWEKMCKLAKEAGKQGAQQRIGAEIISEQSQEEGGVMEDIITFARRTACLYPDLKHVEHFRNSEGADADVWVSPSRKQVILTPRGTEDMTDVSTDLRIVKREYNPVSAEDLLSSPSKIPEGESADRDEAYGSVWVGAFARERLLVHAGFLDQYTAENFFKHVIFKASELIRENPEYTLFVCGHSLGGALAVLCSYDLARVNPSVAVTCVTLGSPRVGNLGFAMAVNEMKNLDVYRVQNNMDFVTRVPFKSLGYYHVGHHIWLRGGKVIGPSKKPGSAPRGATRSILSFWKALPGGGSGSGSGNSVVNHSMSDSDGYIPHLYEFSQKAFKPDKVIHNVKLSAARMKWQHAAQNTRQPSGQPRVAPEPTPYSE